MTGPQIGSLCTGYSGLDMAVMDVPNHGDITAIDWSQVEPIDILTAGFPCQDVSAAGLQAGIGEGTNPHPRPSTRAHQEPDA